MVSQNTSSYNNVYRFSGKELDEETGLSYFGARYYNPKWSVWLGVDPEYAKYPNWSPYNYCFNNPINFVDPDGRDPIYGKNFWGKVKLIGDDGKNNGGSYLVRGSVKNDVKSSTKAGQNYTGSLSENKNVFHVPTGQILEDVKLSVNKTIMSGDSAQTRLEHGAHAVKGESNARHWDAGMPKTTEISTDSEGNQITISKWSVTPFKINGLKQYGFRNWDDLSFVWHTHPNGSNPSPGDINLIEAWRGAGFKGNTFLIDVNNLKVNFFNEQGTRIKVNYSDFLRMGNQEKIE